MAKPFSEIQVKMSIPFIEYPSPPFKHQFKPLYVPRVKVSLNLDAILKPCDEDVLVELPLEYLGQHSKAGPFNKF